MISPEHKFLFIHVPKTGGNAIQTALKPFSPDETYVKNPEVQDGIERFALLDHQGKKISKHSSYRDYLREYGEAIDGYYCFATLRNPYAKLLSHYFSPNLGRSEFNQRTFIKFVERQKPLQHYICDENEDAKTPRLLRFEALEIDFAKICSEIGLGHLSLPIRNAGAPRNYRDFLNQDARKLIERIHAYELDLGEYSY